MPDLAFNVVVTSPPPLLPRDRPSQTALVFSGRGSFEERWSRFLGLSDGWFSSGYTGITGCGGMRETAEAKRPSSLSPSEGKCCHRDLSPVVLTLTLTTGWEGVHWAALL